MSAVLDNNTNTREVSPRLIRDINRVGADEVDREGQARGLKTTFHTMRTGDLCASQGREAALGFVEQAAKG